MFTRTIELLLFPFTLLGKGAARLMRLLAVLPAISFRSKGRVRTRLILVAILLAVLMAGMFDYPRYWNAGASWTNSQLERVDVPTSVERYDRWGIFYSIDNAVRVPHFVDRAYSLGLDLQGGIHLVYEANLSHISGSEQTEAMAALRDIIERRVNILGVSEPVVQVQRGEDSSRLIIELAGIKDPAAAIQAIGQTPYLEFRELLPLEEQTEILTGALSGQITEEQIAIFCNPPSSQDLYLFTQAFGKDPCFGATALNGQYLDSASVQTHPQTGGLQIGLQFDSEGAELFRQITARNIGQIVAIYLDGIAVSLPRVQDEISGGQAVITGTFTAEEARDLARNLNAGALPVPITLISQQKIGASLGAESLAASLRAGLIGILAVVLFLILVYRFAGILAVLSLASYLIILLALIKLIPITLTLAGIAGLILSIGMAVDANVLVFERLREELRGPNTSLSRAIDNAFIRAWPSIRDGNISTLMTAAVLFWLSTSFVKGFALTLGIGILISMFSSMILTKYLMKLFLVWKFEKIRFIWTR